MERVKKFQNTWQWCWWIIQLQNNHQDYFPKVLKGRRKEILSWRACAWTHKRARSIVAADIVAWLIVVIVIVVCTVAASCWITWPSWDVRPVLPTLTLDTQGRVHSSGVFGQVNDEAVTLTLPPAHTQPQVNRDVVMVNHTVGSWRNK